MTTEHKQELPGVDAVEKSLKWLDNIVPPFTTTDLCGFVLRDEVRRLRSAPAAPQQAVAWIVDRTADAVHMDAYRVESEAIARRDYLVSTGNYETVVLIPVVRAPQQDTPEKVKACVPTEPHVIGALERAATMFERVRDELMEDFDYSAEFPGGDARTLRTLVKQLQQRS